MSDHTVFIVDDSEPDRYLTRHEIESASPAVHIIDCSDGVKFLSVLRDTHAHSTAGCIGILLDINMPSLTGFDVLDEIAIDPDLSRWVSRMCVCVILTSSDDVKDRARAASYDLGVGYFTKPPHCGGGGRIIQPPRRLHPGLTTAW